MIRYQIILLLVFMSLDAIAARPFVTDDARLTTAGSCQLENWTRVYRESKEIWALPACNPTGNFELTVGAGYASNNGENGTSDYLYQAKTLFRQLKSDDWGIGLAIGTIRHPAINPGPNLLGNTYAYIPMSVSLNNDAVVLHSNIGWLKDRLTKEDRITWGIGAEFQASPRLLAIAETFGDHRTRPYWQVGARFAIIPDKVQIDATVGQQFSGPSGSQWISFGLRLTPASLF